jgi:hypothetical protein
MSMLESPEAVQSTSIVSPFFTDSDFIRVTNRAASVLDKKRDKHDKKDNKR